MQKFILAIGLKAQRGSEVKVRMLTNRDCPLVLVGVRNGSLAHELIPLAHELAESIDIHGKEDFLARLFHEYRDIGHIPGLAVEHMLMHHTVVAFEPKGPSMVGGLIRITRADNEQVLLEDLVTSVTPLVFES